MAKLEVEHEFQGISTEECFKKCVSLIDSIGYTLFKKRDIANLIICNRTEENSRIDLTLSVSFDNPTIIRLNLSSDDLDEHILNSESSRIFQILSENI